MAPRPLGTNSFATAFRTPRRSLRQVGHQQWRSSSSGSRSTVSSPLRISLWGTSLAASLCVGYLYLTDTRASVHAWLVPPLLRALYADAEDAHHAGTAALKLLYALGLHPRERSSASDENTLAVSVFGTSLRNPVGVSAGLDKDAEIPDALFALGAAVVEVGGITPLPQAGNPRPRVFRAPTLDGLVNRYGLNSRGADAVAAELRKRARLFARSIGVSEADVLAGRATLGGTPIRPGSLRPDALLAVQIAMNKATDGRDVAAAAADYAYCVRRLAPYADVLVVNVSSPNTPGLRDLQAAEPLTRILTAVVDEAKRVGTRSPGPRVMVKVSPDEDDDTQLEGVARAVWASGVDGVIVGNTTRRRTGLVSDATTLPRRDQLALAEDGGFSGPPMFSRTLDLVRRYRKILDGHAWRGERQVEGKEQADGPQPGTHDQKVIFATGGITNGRQALQVLNAGASVAMVYTGLVYGGSGTITRIKGEMREAREQRSVE